MDTMSRLERLAAALPETQRVDIEAWDGEPTFRVRNKVFVFTSAGAERMTLKLGRDEAEAVVATEPSVALAGYGMGRHGWVSVEVGARVDDAHWEQVAEWVRTSYLLVAPTTLARQVQTASG